MSSEKVLEPQEGGAGTRERRLGPPCVAELWKVSLGRKAASKKLGAHCPVYLSCFYPSVFPTVHLYHKSRAERPLLCARQSGSGLRSGKNEVNTTQFLPL